MKTRNLALKVALNSFLTIMIAFIIIQAFNYVRDAILLETGSFGDFLGSFATYMGTRVLPVLLLFSAIIFFSAQPIQKTIAKIERGEATDQDEISSAKRKMRTFRALILTLNLIGFATGYVLDLIILKKLGVAFQLNRLIQLFYNLASGAVYSISQNAVNNIIFTGPRELLKIEKLEEGVRDQGIRRKNVLLTIFVTAYAMLFLYTNTTAGLEQEGIYAEVLEQGVKLNLTIPQIEDLYQQKTSDLLAEKSSRLQLEPERIIFPMDRLSAADRFDAARDTTIILFLIIMGIAFGVQFASSSEIKNRIQRITGKMRDILEGEGDLTQRIHLIQFDEIGNLANAINMFIGSLNELLGRVLSVSNRVAESSNTMRGSLQQAASAVEQMVAATEQTRKNIKVQHDLAEEAQDHFTSLFDAISSITKNVESQATFVEETSSSIEEMAANIRSVSEATEKANARAEGLEQVAREGGKSVDDTIASIREIEQASGKVTQIVGMLQDLTEQTNLLAMNAAIEAAHAGQLGKGFAVVASEVKTLAEDGTEQARRIIGYIDSMTETIKEGVELTDRASVSLSRIADDTQGSARIIQEISAAMREQTSGANQIVSAVESVVGATHTIRQNAIDQDELGKELQGFMTRLVAVSQEIDQSAGEQATGNSEVVGAVQSVYEEAENNQEAVQSLTNTISKFKLG